LNRRWTSRRPQLQGTKVTITEDRQTQPRGRLRPLLILLPLAAIFTAEIVARGTLPFLLRDHPLLLIILDSNTHDLLLASAKISAIWFFSVAVAWRFTKHYLYYMLGRWYGDRILRWIGKRSALAVWITDRVERIFKRFSSLAVFLFSDDLVALLAGTTGMSILRFAALHFLGTILHITILFFIAKHLHGPIVHVTSFIDSGSVILIALFIAFAIASALFTLVAHRRHIGGLASLLRPVPADSTPSVAPSVDETHTRTAAEGTEFKS
jgi:membrane protein DedA with SNARE-associated domain